MTARKAETAATRAADMTIAGWFCERCTAFRDHGMPVKTCHSRTGKTGCPECRTASLCPVVAMRGDERTVTGGYIPTGQRTEAVPLGMAWMKARDVRSLHLRDRDGRDAKACVASRPWCPGVNARDLGCFACYQASAEPKPGNRNRDRDDHADGD